METESVKYRMVQLLFVLEHAGTLQDTRREREGES